MPLRDKQTLPQPEEENAVIPCVNDASNAGKPRKIFLRNLPEIQQRLKPFMVEIERVKLVEYSGVDASNRASETSPNNLDFKEGTSTRWTFDEFQYLEFELFLTSRTKSTFISRPAFANSPSARIFAVIRSSATIYRALVWRNNASSFRLDWFANNSNNSQFTSSYLKAIYGIKHTIVRR